MDWKLVHQDVGVTDNSNIVSRSRIDLLIDTVQVTIADTVTVEQHVAGTKKILMDTAYRLEEMARQMKSKAQKIN